MADNLGGLFDSDPGFLEELASGAEETPQPVAQQQPMGGLMQVQNSGSIIQNSGAIPQNLPMVQQQSHSGYANVTNIQGTAANYANMQQYQQPQAQTQQFNQAAGYGQFNNSVMYSQSTPNQQQGHMITSPTGQQVMATAGQVATRPQAVRGQFGVQQPAMMGQQQQQVMFSYGNGNAASSGPRLPNPNQQQQIKMQMQQGWGQGGQMYSAQQTAQQPQQQQMPSQANASYLNQPYAATQGTANTQIRLQQQPYPGQQQQTIFLQQQHMNSPGRMPTPVVASVSQSNVVGMQKHMYPQQHNTIGVNQSFQKANIPPQQTTNVSIPDTIILQQQQQQQFIQQKQGATAGQYQQFPYRSPPQQVLQTTLVDNTGAAVQVSPQQQQNLVRFQQTSPTQPTNVQQAVPQQHVLQFNNITVPQQRNTVPMSSPRPTPPSPSITPGLLSPTGSTSSHQGSTFNAMEPSPQNNSAKLFASSANTETVVNDMNITETTFQPSPYKPNMNQVSPKQNNSVANAANSNVNVNTNISPVNKGQSQVSPAFKVILSPTGSAGSTSPGSGGSEVQKLTHQIQQLYAMQQTPQTQQKILDLQEKVRVLKSQQPLPVQQQQRQVQTFQQTQVQQQQQPVMVSVGGAGTVGQVGGVTVANQVGNTVTLQVNTASLQPAQKVQLVQATTADNTPGMKKIFIIQQPSASQPGSQPTIVQSGTVAQAVPASINLPQPITVQQAGSQPITVQQAGSQPITVQQGNIAALPQQIVINQALSSGGKTQHIVVQTAPPVQQQTQPMKDGAQSDAVSSTSQQQEKANKIIAEAIAKAQKSGNSTIPRILEPPELPATLGDVDNLDVVGDGGGLVIKMEEGEEPPKKKKKRKYTPREKKEKVPREKKEKKKRDRSKKPKVEENSTVVHEGEPSAEMSEVIKTENEELTIDVGTEEKEKKPKKKKSSSEKKEKTPRSEKKKVKKPPATFIKAKKRKRRGSSDGSDLEVKITPPPSPENDDLKRRSGRHAKRKKYLDDVDLNLSDDGDLNVGAPETEGAVIKPDNPTEEDAVIVDKILGTRIRKRDLDLDDGAEDEEEAEEYFVKYKNFSYLHCEWKTENEIKDKRIQGKIRRYRMKKMQLSYFDDDEELFNPDYVEVDRVLEESFTRDPVTGEDVVHYLVKWRSLPYEDSTWELQQDVDPYKVKIFKKFQELPPDNERKRKPRPKCVDDWEELKETHMYKGDNTLREYQLEGVNWLTFSWYKKQNCILADEMGLGKTIQSIAFLQEMYNYGVRGPFLVVAPLSTIANWQREFETWTDLNAVTYHGTSPSRYMLQEYELYFRDEEGGKIRDCYKFHALITTYEIILSDLELLKTIDWRCIIIDEAHRLKNKNCSLIKCLRSLDFEHKVLLSGTPLQNNVEELFSLLNFLEPSQFHSAEVFLVEFGTLKTEEQVDKLKAILKPMMLRRLKEDVEKNLAAKEETIIEVELTNNQKKYYRAILEKNFSFLCKGATTGGNVPNLMNTMMELRKCCNHPYLINGAEENILEEMRGRDGGREPEHIQALIQASGKFVLLDKLLPKLKQNGNRVLIFSQMIRVLDIIEDYLINKRYLYERLDGRIRGNLRQEAIDRYSKPDSDRFVFLICTKAGGLGINLTAADTVIIYDSDWNPQNDLQAQARCHRIGQSKMVKVYRLITRNSYEREMFDRASMKLGLDKAVLQSIGGEKVNPQAQLSKREIEDLLRKGAYGALMEDDSAGDKFCEEDIDQILKGRTQVIQIESEGKGSTFAKASFSMTSNRDDIDINDPEFWQKWAKRADVDTENLDKKELIVDEPRRRKKTTRYGNNDGLADISDLGSDSDSDEDGSSKQTRKNRRGKRGGDIDEDFDKERHKAKGTGGSGYGRSELFKVEKGLLHYGWGRWSDILLHTRFKRPMVETDIESVAKAILLYGLQYYKGDERIKEFIWDLVSQANNEDGGLKNHSGLSAPVPRGRKGKKAKNEETNFEASEEIEKAGIKMDREIVLNKNAYKRHIARHSNKVLLRVRTLYYLKHEVLGDAVEQVDQNMHVRDVTRLAAPVAEGEPPTYWWDELADKSLLIGVYKHGYEKYNSMRQDPNLVFLSRCGPPDGAALAAELKDDDDNENDDDDKIDSSILKDDEDDSLSCPPDVMMAGPKLETLTAAAGAPGIDDDEEEGKLPFPTASEMNTRLRKIITNYQRDYKKQQLKIQQQAKKVEKRERLDAMFREREARRKETQQRWTRREETDFYRVVSTYGIEFDRIKGRYIWDKFRVMARLDKKTDEQLTEYFISFYHMCLRVCRKIKEEAYPPTPIYIEAITEERANRCIARIDLLSKIREEIIVHPKMEQRIKLCQRSYDLPQWWNNGRHDRELLVGAAKHGLARTEYYIMNDPVLSFLAAIKAETTQANSPANFQLFGKDVDKKEPMPDTIVIGSKDIKPEENIKTENDIKQEKSIKTETEIKEENEKEIEQENEKEIKQEKDMKEDIKEEIRVKEEYTDMEVEEDIKTETTAGDGDEVSSDKVITSKNTDEPDTEKDENKMEEESESSAENKSDVKSDDGESKDNSENEDKNKEGEETVKVVIKTEPSDKSEQDENVGEEIAVKSEPVEDATVEGEPDKPVKSEDSSSKDGLTNGLSENGEKDDVKKEMKDEPKDDLDEDNLDNFEDNEDWALSSVPENLLAQWPKDRVVFHRLEQICYCVETGEWPFPPKMKNVHILGIDSGSNTPTRSQTPSSVTPATTPAPGTPATGTATPKHDEDTLREARESRDSVLRENRDAATRESREAAAMERLKKEKKDFEVQLGESLKVTFHKKAEKNKRDLQEAEKAARIQAILAQSLAASQASSDDSQQEPILSQAGSDSPFLNGSRMSEEELLMNRSLMEQGLMFPDRRGRRGRKRKAEKMAEIAMAEALARRQTARAVASFDQESHVPVINLEDGSRLSGEEAPLKKDLDSWLEKHPGYMVDSRDDELEEGEIIPDFPERRKGRKPKFDPAILEVEKLTGEENVSVVNRLTGKKITGAKAPPLRYLAEWLEQNPMWDVDPKWSELVRAKGTLPKTLLPRVGTPSRRGRRPRDSPLSHSMMGGASSDPHQAAALAASIEAMNAAQLMAAGFGKLPLPFGSLPGLGMNPLLGLSGFGFPPGMPTSSPIPTETKSDVKHTKEPVSTPKSSKEDGEKLKEDEKNSSSSPHPSFPLMFNPLLYNPALLAAHSMAANFPLPTSLAGLDSGLLNGHTQVADEERPKPKPPRVTVPEPKEQNHAQDLSVKPKSKSVVENTIVAHSSSKSKANKDVSFDSNDMPCDLSMKSKPKESKEQKDEDKSKQKICSSDKLSRIVDSLKFRVNKMDDRPMKGSPDDKVREKRDSLEALLNMQHKPSESRSSKSEHQESRSGKKDVINSLSHQKLLQASSSASSSLSSSSSQNHTKEPVPKIVQELLAAKQREKEELLAAKQREKEELLAAKQRKLDDLLAKQEKLVNESRTAKAAQQKLSVAQGSNDDSVEEAAAETGDDCGEKS